MDYDSLLEFLSHPDFEGCELDNQADRRYIAASLAKYFESLDEPDYGIE